MLVYIAVALGGGAGAVFRLALLEILDHEKIPYGTIAVNIIGSFIIGIVAAIFLFMPTHILSSNSRIFITSGLLGGFTTFSAFSLDSMKLIQNGDMALAAFYILASVIGSIIAVFIGYSITKYIII